MTIDIRKEDKMSKKRIGAFALSFGLVASAATAASALTYSPDPIPGTGEHVVHVVSDRTDLPPGDYKVSLCTVTSSALEIPLCLDSGSDSNSVDNFPGGQLEADVSGVKKENMDNAHHNFFPWQDDTFSCVEPGSCEFLIVQHESIHKTVHERKVAVFE